MSDSVLLVFLAVAAVIHIAGITILGVMLRESLRITRAVGALVIQEEEKTRRVVSRLLWKREMAHSSGGEV